MKLLEDIFFVFILVFLSTSSWSQSISQNIIGKWHLESENIQGTSYLSNEWNSESISFLPDYSFVYSISHYENKHVISNVIEGSWVIAKDSSAIILFNNQNHFQKGIALKTVFKNLPIYFSNKNYLAWSDISYNLPSIKQFSKGTASASFEEEYVKYQHELVLRNKIIDMKTYVSIQDKDTLYKKYQNAYYTLLIKNKEVPNSSALINNSTIDGKILKITDSSIFIKPRFIYHKTISSKNTTQRSFEFLNNFPKEVPLQNIQKLHLPISAVGMKASFWFTVASTTTTLIVAPIISVVSAKENAKKNYLNTAGVGLIGMGIGTGSFFIFHSLEKKFQAKTKNGVLLQPYYIKKK